MHTHTHIIRSRAKYKSYVIICCDVAAKHTQAEMKRGKISIECDNSE